MYPKTYLTFWKEFNKTIAKQESAFGGASDYVIEALNNFIEKPYPYDKEQFSDINKSVRYSFVSITRNVKGENEETYNYDVNADKIKLTFPAGSHPKSFKELKGYNSKADVTILLNLDNNYLSSPEVYMTEKNRAEEYAQILFDINENETMHVKSYFANDESMGKRRFLFYSNYDRSYENYNKLNFIKKFLYVHTNYESKESSTKKQSFKQDFVRKFTKSNLDDDKSEYMKTKKDVRRRWFTRQEEQRQRKEELRKEHAEKRKQEQEEIEEENHERIKAEYYKEFFKRHNANQQKQNNQNNQHTNKVKQEEDKNNYYKLLNVPYDASVKQIKTAYRTRMMKEHPDVSEHPDATKRASILNDALDILTDPFKRSVYNRKKGIDAKVRFNEKIS